MSADRTTSAPGEHHLPAAGTPASSRVVREEPAWLALKRTDLAAMVAKYREEHRQPRQWIGSVVGTGALATALLLIRVAEARGWRAAFVPVTLASGWAIALGSFALVWWRERQLRTRHQLACPACEAPLLDGSIARGGVARADLVITTGQSPVCGERILAP